MNRFKYYLASSSFRFSFLIMMVLWLFSAILIITLHLYNAQLLRQSTAIAIDDQIDYLFEQIHEQIKYQQPDQAFLLNQINIIKGNQTDEFEEWLSHYKTRIQTLLESDGNNEESRYALSARLYLIGELETLPAIENALHKHSLAGFYTALLLLETPDQFQQDMEETIELNIERWEALITNQLDAQKLLHFLDNDSFDDEIDCLFLYDKNKQLIYKNKISKDSLWWQSGNLEGWEVSGSIEYWDQNSSTMNCLMRRMDLPQGGELLLGYDFSAQKQQIYQSQMLCYISVISTFLLASVLALFIARRFISRIENMNQVCQQVREGALSYRIPSFYGDQDLQLLSENFNSMMDQMEQMIHDQSRMSDNIAHDLRTPLTRLRGQLDLIMQQQQPSQQGMQALSEEVDQLLTTFNALLRIARLENRGQREGFRRFDMKQLIDDVAELYEPAFAEREQNLIHSTPANNVIMTGDPDLWMQAISNLMDNILKYAGNQGDVKLILDDSDQLFRILIQDNGPGIPKLETENVFKRFYRLEKHRGKKGAGLGLSLVASVCDLHRAKIQLDGENGLKVIILLESKTSGKENSE